MGRKKFIRKREILPDPKFNDVVVAKFISSLLSRVRNRPRKRIFSAASMSMRNDRRRWRQDLQERLSRT